MTGMPMPAWLLPFLGAAALMMAAATAGLGWAAGGGARRWTWGLALGVPLAVLALYVALGHPRAINPAERQRAPQVDPATMVQGLADKLAREGGSPAQWTMLARSYKVLGRHAEAAATYERALPALMRDADALADWIEARLLANGERFDARTLDLLAQARQLAPQHDGVLLLDGLAALQQGDRPRAQARFSALRDALPEGSPDRQAMDQALAEIAQGRDPRRGAAVAGIGAPETRR